MTSWLKEEERIENDKENVGRKPGLSNQLKQTWPLKQSTQNLKQ